MSNPDDYTVGWICAITTEYVAARAILDDKHEGPQMVSAHDNNSYTLGRIGKHNVVMAILPDGEHGISSAARVAADLSHSFPSIRIRLLVGIGGGAPSRRYDIRLGDVVVSSPGSNNGGSNGGVFQYDFGKTVQEQSFQTTGFLNQPPPLLRAAIIGLKAQYEAEGHQFEAAIGAILKKNPRLRKKYQRPDTSSDRLYQSHICHPINDESNCTTTCGNTPSTLVLRPERDEDEDNPTIHYGLIASASQLMQDAIIRDKLTEEKNIKCFEMEAAGLMNHFPCLVIRGICDYSDSHKNKEWQGYAAMVAAMYAKDLLGQIAPNKVIAEKKIGDFLSEHRDSAKEHQDTTGELKDTTKEHQETTEKLKDTAKEHQDTTGELKDTTGELKDTTGELKDTTMELQGTTKKHRDLAEENQDVTKKRFQTEEEETCHQLFLLTNSDRDATYKWYKDRVPKRAEGTCLWFLGHENFQAWLKQDSGPLLVTADPGCGKSVLAKYLVEDYLPQFETTVCYFFFTDHVQNTVRQALCALLHQLFIQKPCLIKHAVSEFRKDGLRIIRSKKSLWTILQNATKDPQAGSTLIVLDALDECAGPEFADLIHNIENQFYSNQCGNLRYLLTCRPDEAIESEFCDLSILTPKYHIQGQKESGAIRQEMDCVIDDQLNRLSGMRTLSPEFERFLKGS